VNYQIVTERASSFAGSGEYIRRAMLCRSGGIAAVRW